MKHFKNILIFAILFFIASCNEPKRDNETSTEFSEQKFRWENPDENATIKIVNTNTSINDDDLISKLEEDFKKEKFKIESVELIKENSYNNCKDNQILKLRGNGIKKYYIKRIEAKPKNYYPDFMMWVYEFETEEETIATEKEIRKAFDSGNGFCNGKAPEYFVRYKNKIVHLGTRAEMFRGYIKNYAETIKKLNE